MSAVKRNVAWLLLSQGATWIASILTLLIVPNELGDQLFGDLSFALVYVSVFGLVATYGTSEFLTKTLARATGDTGHYLYNTLILKLIASLTACSLAVALGVLLNFDRERILLVAVFAMGMVFTVLNNVMLGGYQALQRMGRPAFWNAISLYVGAISGIMVLFLGGSVVAYALVFNLALAIPLVGNSLGLREELGTSRGLDRRVWGHVIRGGFPFFILSGLSLIYGSVDIAMLEVFAGTETVGWYALAYRWVGMPALFAVSVATAFFPALSAEGAAISDAFRSMANRALYVVLIVAIPAATGIGLVARDFISLVYGSDFAQAVPLIQLMAIAIPIIGLDVVLGTVVVAIDRQRQWMMFSMAAAVFNPLANLVAIPYAMDRYDNGAIGAAFTTVLTEGILMVGAFVIIPRGILGRQAMGVGFRVVAASAAMVPVVLALGSTPLYTQIGAGAIVYTMASFGLKTISTDEIRQLRRGLANRGALPSADEATIDS